MEHELLKGSLPISQMNFNQNSAWLCDLAAGLTVTALVAKITATRALQNGVCRERKTQNLLACSGAATPATALGSSEFFAYAFFGDSTNREQF
jgi:hypothetical protein